MSIEKDGSGRGNPATWIEDGEEYALVGLSVKVEDDIPFQQFTLTFGLRPKRRLISPRIGESGSAASAAAGIFMMAIWARPEDARH